MTCDRSIQHQQNIAALKLTVIVLTVPNTRIPAILALMEDLRAVLAAGPQPGTLSIIGDWRVPDG